MDQRDLQVSHFAEFERAAAADTPAWLRSARRAAIDRFAALGLPTTRREDWKYTNLSRLAQVPFAPLLGPAGHGSPAGWLEEVALGGDVAGRAVVLDGHFTARLGSGAALPAGVEMTGLAAALRSQPELLQAHLGRYANDDDNALLALNTAFLNDGVLVRLAPGTVLREPLQLVFACGAPAEARVSHPRVLVLAGAGSQATIVETHVALGAAPALANAVTEVLAGEDSVVEHCRIGLGGENGVLVAVLRFRQQRGSRVTSHVFSLGRGLERNDVNVVLDGEGAECGLNGLFVGRGAAHLDNRTAIDHARPHCGSQELYKGILADRATGVFNGLIRVRPQAQKTSARQTNKNLLLSDEAQVNSKPQLEIYADDVKCNHGSTTGRLDEEAIFFLRSRGIGMARARAILTNAFAAEMVGRVAGAPVREWLEARLADDFGVAAEGEAGQ